MELNTENCVITKIDKKIDGHGTIIEESFITISGKSLKECYEYYERVRRNKK